MGFLENVVWIIYRFVYILSRIYSEIVLIFVCCNVILL